MSPKYLAEDCEKHFLNGVSFSDWNLPLIDIIKKRDPNFSFDKFMDKNKIENNDL